MASKRRVWLPMLQRRVYLGHVLDVYPSLAIAPRRGGKGTGHIATKWFWKLREADEDGAPKTVYSIEMGDATTEHLAKTYAARAAKRHHKKGF